MSRDEKGRWIPGTPGGPGRPARATETAYLRALSDALSLESWTKIVQRAIQDAEGGDARAREWLSRYALPQAEGLQLRKLAARELAGIEDADDLATAAAGESAEHDLERITGAIGRTRRARAMNAGRDCFD